MSSLPSASASLTAEQTVDLSAAAHALTVLAVGISIGSLVFIALCIFLCCWCCRRRRAHETIQVVVQGGGTPRQPQDGYATTTKTASDSGY